MELTLSVVPKIQVVETKENFARFVIEPLEKGFGITLGNSLRRVMLGHLPGAAITHVKIDGIQHNFDAQKQDDGIISDEEARRTDSEKEHAKTDEMVQCHD